MPEKEQLTSDEERNPDLYLTLQDSQSKKDQPDLAGRIVDNYYDYMDKFLPPASSKLFTDYLHATRDGPILRDITIPKDTPEDTPSELDLEYITPDIPNSDPAQTPSNSPDSPPDHYEPTRPTPAPSQPPAQTPSSPDHTPEATDGTRGSANYDEGNRNQRRDTTNSRSSGTERQPGKGKEKGQTGSATQSDTHSTHRSNTKPRAQPRRTEKESNLIESLEKSLTDSFYLDVIGVNDLRNEHELYGKIGEAIGKSQYASVITGSKADKVRKELYEEELKAKEALGIADMPDYTSNYQIVKYVLSIVNDAASKAPLTSLEKVLNSIDKKIEFNIPDELINYEERKERIIKREIEAGTSRGSIAERIREISDENSEKIIGAYRNTAYSALRRAAAFKMYEKHKYDDINAEVSKISKAYEETMGIKEAQAQSA